jgi:hypothetical protein
VAKYCLSSSPTHFISLLCRLPELNAQGRIPAQANGQPYTIPGFPPIAPLDLPRTLQGDQKKSEFLFYHGACLWRATGFLVNSVYELETSIIEGLKDMLQTGCQVNRVRSTTNIAPCGWQFCLTNWMLFWPANYHANVPLSYSYEIFIIQFCGGSQIS